LTTLKTTIILRLRFYHLFICPRLSKLINCTVILILNQRNCRLSCFRISCYLFAKINCRLNRLRIRFNNNTCISNRSQNIGWRSFYWKLRCIWRTRCEVRFINSFESKFTRWTDWAICTRNRHKEKIGIHICRYKELRWKVSSVNESCIIFSQFWNEVSELISWLDNKKNIPIKSVRFY